MGGAERRPVRIDKALAARLHGRAGAARWRVSIETFAGALEESAGKAFAGRLPGTRELERYLDALHLEDLALACACRAGDEAAWEHFIREWRPLLYRAAGAIDPAGNTRELADALYADLYGMEAGDGTRRSLLRYFHGRSSLGTWLRAVLAQRHVDGVRAARRVTSLPDEESTAVLAAPARPPDPDRERFARLLQEALEGAIGGLTARDRLRLGCYYAQQLTLAETGRLLQEHEATVSRQLARTRRDLRLAVERALEDRGLGPAEVDECFAAVLEDAGSLDLHELIDGPRKNAGGDRSR